MKTEELMIGDWVLYREEVLKVTSLYTKRGANEIGFGESEDFWVDISNIEPIPLTPEILEKNGFEADDKNKDMLYWNWSICEDCVSYDKETGTIRIFHTLGRLVFVHPLRYVHELQHALRLCGIEKEIEL